MNIPPQKSNMPPEQLAGFEHIKRYWDQNLELWVARIMPGEYYTSIRGEAITTVLGSCVACCIRDPEVPIAGMNHFMLPETQGVPDWGNEISSATRYGSHAMEQLINSIVNNGGDRNRLEAKLFGGGRVLTSMTDIGSLNIDFAHKYLLDAGIPLVAEDTGGINGRKVVYLSANGRVRVRPLATTQTVAERESDYLQALVQQPVSDNMGRY